MFRNYLAAALRNLFRNRAYAAVNILGLTLAFTTAILIALFVLRPGGLFGTQHPNPRQV